MSSSAKRRDERRDFRLSGRQYDAFVAALDSPTKPKPRLDRLLKTPSIIE